MHKEKRLIRTSKAKGEYKRFSTRRTRAKVRDQIKTSQEDIGLPRKLADDTWSHD